MAHVMMPPPTTEALTASNHLYHAVKPHRHHHNVIRVKNVVDFRTSQTSVSAGHPLRHGTGPEMAHDEQLNVWVAHDELLDVWVGKPIGV